MPPPSSQFKMADRLLGGRLAALLRDYRSQELSGEDMAKRLFAEAGVEVSGETCRRWTEALAATEGAA